MSGTFWVLPKVNPLFHACPDFPPVLPIQGLDPRATNMCRRRKERAAEGFSAAERWLPVPLGRRTPPRDGVRGRVMGAAQPARSWVGTTPTLRLLWPKDETSEQLVCPARTPCGPTVRRA